MAESEPVAQLRKQHDPLPEVIEFDTSAGMPPHSPRETSMLKEMTGRSFQELAGENADAGDREQVLVWFKLRRLGFEPSWEEAGDVLIDYVTPNPPSGGDSTSSPPSAGSGG
jgi:hypothetical protein